MNLTRPLRLYGTLVLACLKAKINYRADFLIMAGSAALMQGMGYIFLWVVFVHGDEIERKGIRLGMFGVGG